MTSTLQRPTPEQLEAVRTYVVTTALDWSESATERQHVETVLNRIFSPSVVSSTPTPAQLAAVKQFVVDTALQYARENGLCSEVEEALETVFPDHVGPWLTSDGRDCRGVDHIADLVQSWTPEYRARVRELVNV